MPYATGGTRGTHGRALRALSFLATRPKRIASHAGSGTTLAPRDRPTDAALRRREEPYG
jgi:hypothetical protein